jgi:hypothetical protein
MGLCRVVVLIVAVRGEGRKLWWPWRRERRGAGWRRRHMLAACHRPACLLCAPVACRWLKNLVWPRTGPLADKF